MKNLLRVMVVVVFALLGSAFAQTAQLPDFTYQGRLQQDGQPATGAYDLSFALYDAASGGVQIGTTIVEPQFPVTAGLFTVSLAFPGAFTGSQRWLQVMVNGQPLLPRQPVSTTPVAQYALNGNPGPAGPIGPAGPQGSTGVAGPAGATGPAGAIGATGPVGAVGPAGNTGPAGAEGPQGPIGNTGATGEIGPQGPIGMTGATGAVGPQGPIGNTGAVGATGEAGSQGPIGATGAVGPQGPIGNTGPVGANGDIGPAGPQGPAGGSFADAPANGNTYARRNNAWIEIDPSSGLPSMQGAILADNPTLYYPLDEAPGATSFRDEGSAGLDVALSGDAITLQPGWSRLFPTSDASYLRMNEGNGKASAVGNPMGTPTPTGSFTVEAIYSPQVNGADLQPILFIGDDAPAIPFLTFGVINLQPYIQSGNDTRVDLSGLTAGAAYHIAAVVDTSVNEVRIYINGRLLQVQSMFGYPFVLLAPKVYVASRPAADRPFVYATLGHVAFFYGQALSVAQVAAHAQAAGLYGH